MVALQHFCFTQLPYNATTRVVDPVNQDRLTCCMIVVAQLFTRRGAAVSANVRLGQVDERELGPVLYVSHTPQRPARRYDETTDQAIAAALLLKVQQTHPEAKMYWHEEETSWYIRAPRPKIPALKAKPLARRTASGCVLD